MRKKRKAPEHWRKIDDLGGGLIVETAPPRNPVDALMGPRVRIRKMRR